MDPVSTALRAVPRTGFLPRRERARAGFDGPIQIGHGQTNSQPRTVEAMLRLLEVRPGDRVLDVGAGSGWTTALLAHLTGEQGTVIGVELVPELADWGAQNLADVSASARASIRPAIPGVLGWPGAAPYDRIMVSAGAQTMPQELVGQMAEEGRIVVPVQGTMTLGIRHGDDLETSTHGSYRFVPLL